MIRHLPLLEGMCENTSKRLLMLVVAMLLPVLSLPAFALAASDSVMQQSLVSFFNSGVVVRGASAELIRVERWPVTSGAIRWSLPLSLRGHPKRFSLVAEQGGKRWYVPVRVHWWAMAVVMVKDIPARSLLTQSMLKRTRTDIAGHSGHLVRQNNDAVGMRLTRRMYKGDLLLSNHMKRPPLIQRGELVTMIVEFGGLHVRTQGKAMRSAQQGQRLLVKNLRSQQVVQAIVESAGAVRVLFQGAEG
ncbi:MAG: flagellar basal body P-ring formation chaperone FlgA [Mariprofundus sp.]|nr:flagellar basal body P-ring formation chaperone FlgA [Mariprofundus sp.]